MRTEWTDERVFHGSLAIFRREVDFTVLGVETSGGDNLRHQLEITRGLNEDGVVEGASCRIGQNQGVRSGNEEGKVGGVRSALHHNVVRGNTAGGGEYGRAHQGATTTGLGELLCQRWAFRQGRNFNRGIRGAPPVVRQAPRVGSFGEVSGQPLSLERIA